MKEIIFDIVRHASNLAGVDMIKIIGDKTSTKVHAEGPGRNVVLLGSLKEPMTEVDGTIGLMNVGFLNGLTNLYIKDMKFYSDEPAKVEETKKDPSEYSSEINLKIETDKGASVPDGLVFKDSNGSEDTYRFNTKFMDQEDNTSSKMFKEPAWSLEFDLINAQSKISEFVAKAGVYKSINESTFTVNTAPNKQDPSKTDLVFNFGKGSHTGNNGHMIFKTNIKGTMNQSLEWPVDTFLSIIKLGMEQRSNSKVQFSQNACMVTVESRYATYKYVMPGLTR